MPDLGNRHQALRELTESRAWAELKQIVAEKREAKVRQIGTAFLAGDPPPDIDYERGYFAGMKFLLDSPERVESQLERALRRQENTEGDRDAV